jgi:hypothetical protein
LKPLELLGRSLLGRRYAPQTVFAMMTCYFDESGGQDLGWTFVCGYAATVAQWDNFEIDWKLCLAKYNVDYFHMKEYAHFKGPFKGWDAPRMEATRISFMRDASEIIRSNVQRTFVSLVSHNIFEEIDSRYKFSETFGSPYALAGRACIGHANTWRSRTAPAPLDMEYVFEDGGPDRAGLVRAMTVLPPYLDAPSFKPSRNMKPCKKWPHGRTGIVQLQAADYLAYEMRKLLIDHELVKQGQRDVRTSLKALTGVPLDKALMTTGRLELICKRANIEPRA